MASSATASAAVRAAFTQFIDYAGLFPPAKLDMAPALREYAACRQGPYAWMLGRFIVPASRIPELLAALAPVDAAALSAIVDAGNDPRAWLARVQKTLEALAHLRESQTRVTVESLEIALPPLGTKRDTYDAPIGQFAAALEHSRLADLPAFVELPRDHRWAEQLDTALFALARHGLGAKLRCGGLTADAFPTAEDVAAFVRAAIGEHRVPMKATAGLHHPIRHFDPALGVPMHGFLNLLTAAAFARNGMDAADLARIVACEDSRSFHLGEAGLEWEDERVNVDRLRETRAQAFIAYGSCSFSEPTDDLRALDIL